MHWIYNRDCLEVMDQLIKAGVKLDMFLADLPYGGETGNKWDKGIDLKEMFDKLRVLCKDEAAMVFTGTFKFGVQLYEAAPDLYKYDWVWQKDNGTNPPNVNYQPFRVHENIYVFGKGRVTNGSRTPMKYHPQKTKGEPYLQVRSGRMSSNWKGGLGSVMTDNPTGDRHPLTIQYFCRDRGLHPTQKPLALMEYLVKTYSDEGDLIMDPTMGSGTTGLACKNLNRNFIGCELDQKYYEIAKERLA